MFRNPTPTRIDWRFFLLLIHVLPCLAGCSVYMAAHQPTKKDLTVLEQGTPRRLVLIELGTPAASERDKRGNRIDCFQVTQGYSKGSRIGRAFAHGAADLFTVGCWEVIGTPTELAFDGTQLRIQVTYTDGDVVDSATVIGKDGSHPIANLKRMNDKTFAESHESSSEKQATPRRSHQETVPTAQASPKPATQQSAQFKGAKSSFSSAIDEVVTSLVTGAKSNFSKKREGPIRVAVYKFLPREGRDAVDSTIGERITSELERALIRRAGVQLVTRKNLSDIQSEQRLNEANWNQTTQRQRQFGVVDVDLILRGNYAVSNAGTSVRIEFELLDPSGGVVVGAEQVSIEIAKQE